MQRQPGTEDSAPLQFNVASLMRAGIGATSDAPLSPGRIQGDGAGTLVEGDVRLLRTNRGILATVRARLEVDLECARCLATLRDTVECAFDEEFLPVIDVVSGARLNLEDAIEAFRVDEHDILDLAEALRQYGVAAEPMAPVCTDTCRGLCPLCGADLNEAPCACGEPMDPRWAQLQALMITADQTTDEDA
jgi:uncharacterized protein